MKRYVFLTLLLPVLTAAYCQSRLSCPDGNHPHMIDLGLPSGTKWACCNVGAKSPTEYGGLYAWGETATKKDYSLSTYKNAYKSRNGQGMWDFHHDTGYWQVKDLGKCISNTNYDAAHTLWGGGWQMPTHKQFEELLDKCSYKWEDVDGIYCGVFTGPNGASIVIPAAGACRYDECIYRGETGFYWSGSRTIDEQLVACYLYLDEGDAYEADHARERGHSIRPVCK